MGQYWQLELQSIFIIITCLCIPYINYTTKDIWNRLNDVFKISQTAQLVFTAQKFEIIGIKFLFVEYLIN